MNSQIRDFVLDPIFGSQNFRNEVIWKRTNSPKGQTGEFGKQHDSIFFYSKTDRYICNRAYRPIEGDSLRPYSYDDNDGKGPYRLVEIIANGTQKYIGRKKIIWCGFEAMYLYTEENLNKMKDDGLIYISKNGRPSKKQYLKDMPGIAISDLWVDDSVSPIQGSNKETVGYPTQKPEALLERIIKTSS